MSAGSGRWLSDLRIAPVFSPPLARYQNGHWRHCGIVDHDVGRPARHSGTARPGPGAFTTRLSFGTGNNPLRSIQAGSANNPWIRHSDHFIGLPDTSGAGRFALNGVVAGLDDVWNKLEAQLKLHWRSDFNDSARAIASSSDPGKPNAQNTRSSRRRNLVKSDVCTLWLQQSTALTNWQL